MEEAKEETAQEQEQEKPLSIVEEAKKIRDEIKEQNDRREAILKEEQSLKAQDMLGGTTGTPPQKQVEKEESPQEYAKRVMDGGLNERATEE